MPETALPVVLIIYIRTAPKIQYNCNIYYILYNYVVIRTALHIIKIIMKLIIRTVPKTLCNHIIYYYVIIRTVPILLYIIVIM